VSNRRANSAADRRQLDRRVRQDEDRQPVQPPSRGRWRWRAASGAESRGPCAIRLP
jgi:hypothetical protein